MGRALSGLGAVLAVILGVYAIAWTDCALRARSSCLEGERLLAEARRAPSTDPEHSAAKYAMVWLDSAAKLFKAPGNPWSARAATEVLEARELWRSELASRGLKPEDFRLE